MDKQLNEYLANLMVESHKLQAFHWYVKGGDFFTVHARLEEYYDEVAEMVDEVAETLLMCGGQPITTLEEISEASKIKQAKATFMSSAKIFEAIVEDYGLLLEGAEALKEKAEKSGNNLVSVKMDAHIEAFSKALWMLKQSS